MDRYSRSEAAELAGVAPDDLDRLVDHGIISPDQEGRFTAGDARKAAFVATLLGAGLPFEALMSEIGSGRLSIEFIGHPLFADFSVLSRKTFEGLSTETGIPIDLLMVMREAIGSAVPSPSDRVREIELAILPHLQAQLAIGYPPDAIARSLRTMGESLRRHALAEADAFRVHVIERALGAHLTELAAEKPSAIGADELDRGVGRVLTDAAVQARARGGEHADRALLAVFHAQQAQASTANILGGFEAVLARLGLHDRIERPPAMCFLDITGYTRLTAERGDLAAAELADRLRQLVDRISVRYGGRAVKWLGDGVMIYFREPGPGVVAALEMAEAVVKAGLPPSHIGLHAGPVLLQDGDYYGQTVNITSRIANYARPGEVLVSQAVLDAANEIPVVFDLLGPVELKGLASTTNLYAARRPRISSPGD